MSLLDSLPTYTLVLPLLLIAGAWLLSKVLRFSMWVTLLVGCAPFVLPYLDLPFSREFLDSHPMYLIVGGWALLLCFALGRSAVLPLFSDNGRSPAGVARAAYGVLLGGALLVVTLLVSKPELLESSFPGWKGGAGLVLLCASLLSMSLWLARALKAAIVFSIWSVVSLVLASELMLNKLPFEVVREDLHKLEPLASRFGLSDTLKQIETFTIPSADAAPSISDRVKAYVLGVSPNTGYLFPRERSFARALEGVLQRQGVSADVKDAGDYNLSSVQMKEIALTQVAPTKPDFVFLMGWRADAVRGKNSYNMPGRSEIEARAYVSRVRALHNYPFAADVVESVLYRYGSAMVEPDPISQGGEAAPYRVSPSEFKEQLLITIRALQEQGTQVVLLPEPTLLVGSNEYRGMMVDAAQESNALFIPVDEILQRESEGTGGRLFARGALLSQKGYVRVAEIIASALREKSPSLIRAAVVDSHAIEAQNLGTGMLSIGTELPSIIRDEASFLVEPSSVRGDLIFRIKIAEQGSRFYRVVFSVNGEFVADRRLDSRDETRVRFSLPDSAKKYSVVEVTLRTLASPPANEDLVGTTEFFVPTPIQIVTDPLGVSMVKIGRRAFFARSKGHGAVAVSLDPRSGDVLNVLRSDDPTEVNRWILSQPWGTIVSTSLQFADPQTLSLIKPALKFIGASSLSDADLAGVSLIGVTGTRKGEASSSSGKDSVSNLSLGSDILKAYSRFTLFDVRLGERGYSQSREVSAPSVPREDALQPQ